MKPAGYGKAQAVDSIQFDNLADIYNNMLMGSGTEKVCTPREGFQGHAQNLTTSIPEFRARV